MIKVIRTGQAPDLSAKIEVTFPTDPKAIADFRARQERFDRNADWLQAHAREVYTRHRGRHICIAGQELFVADTARDALALAEAAHPDDDGRYFRYIPKEKLPRISAH